MLASYLHATTDESGGISSISSPPLVGEVNLSSGMSPARRSSRARARRPTGTARAAKIPGEAGAPIFLTGRFRSGTTLLWQVLRDAPGVCAYFEPLHDNLLAHMSSQAPPDPTHVGVEDYFAEYGAIGAKLKRVHRAEFGVSRLCLAAKESHPALERYLVRLVEHAGDARAAFKLVRADFRLPWLRTKFPNARIVSIHRDPRDQWASAVRLEPKGRRDRIDANTGYDLLVWANELAPSLPAIGRPHFDHSYEIAYLLSRVSRAVAERYADHRIDFDADLQADPERTLTGFFAAVDLPAPPTSEQLARFVRSERDATREFGDEVPFAEIEAHCDDLLAASGLIEAIAEGELEGRSWPIAGDAAAARLARPLAAVVSDHRSVVLALEAELRRTRSEVERLRTESDGQARRIAEAVAAREAAQDEVADARARHDRDRSELAADLARHREQLDAALAHARGLEAELERRSETGDGLRLELDKVRRDAEIEIVARQEALATAQAHAGGLEERVGALEAALEEASTRSAETLAETRDELERHREAATRARAHADALDRELERIQNDAREQIALAEQGLAEAREYVASLEAELANRDARARELDAELLKVSTDGREQIAALEDQLHTREAYLRSLEDALEGARVEGDNARREEEARHGEAAAYVESLEGELRNREAYARSLGEELAKITRDGASEIDRLKEALDHRDAYARSLVQELEKLRRDGEAEIAARDESRERAETYARSLEAEVGSRRSEAADLEVSLEAEREAFDRERRRWQALHEATHRLTIRERRDAEAAAEEERESLYKWIRALTEDQRAGEESARREIAAHEESLAQARTFIVSLEAELAHRAETARDLRVANERIQRDADEQIAERDERIALREAEVARLSEYAQSLEEETRKLSRDAAKQIRDHESLFSELEHFAESLKVENVRIREAAREQSIDWARRLDDAHDQLQAAIEAGRLENKIKNRLRKIARSLNPLRRSR